MAESVVELLLNELSRVLIEEVNLQRGVRQEIEKIKEELEAMKAFLRVADAKEEEDPRLKSWVKQVRDVAFEIEDVVDEFLLRVADGDDADRPHNTCLGSICSSIRKCKAKHRIGAELQSIKARVNDIAERPKKYGYNIPSPNLYEQGSTSSSATASTKEIDQVRRNALLVDESQLVGIDATKKKLVDWLKDGDSNLKVLAIVGMGGLGKTTLAKQIYNASAVTSRAFVTVSQSLKEDELLKDIVQQLFPEELTQMQQLQMDRLKERIKEKLQKERYLIVLDDVWRTDHWDQVKLSLPRNNCGSRVVITTRKTEVARYSSNEFKGMVHSLQPLSESDSWALFCKKTFPTPRRCPSNLEPICKNILNKCGGVPLAILAIGGVLATKDEHHVEAWEMVQRSLNVELEENPRLSMVNKVLALSFHDLPYHLKPCYMFLSVFPEDYSMEWMRLIRLWISQGFVAKRVGRTLEEVADSYLDELLNRSLIQIEEMRSDGRVKSCRIHDFLREFVVSKSRDQQRFVEVINRGRGDYSTREMETARRLSIRHFDEIKSSLLSRLRSLFFFKAGDTSSSGSSLEMSKFPGDGFKLLSVLDLTSAPLDTFPEEISKLLLLRYLSLRNTRISNLPKSIGNLGRLETLDLRETRVTELPSEISMIRKLRHLLIYNLPDDTDGIIVKITSLTGHRRPFATAFLSGGFKVTADIGGLLSLQKLYYLEASEDSELIKVLGRLIQLRKLCLLNLREQHWSELCSSISKMTNLRSLTLHTAGTFDLRHISSPPPLLQRLRLIGHLDVLPSWVSSLHNLQVLQLLLTGLKKDPGACLGGLPNLTVLVLFYAFHGVKMRVLPGSFSSLRTLMAVELYSDNAYQGFIPEADRDDRWKEVMDAGIFTFN